MSKAKRVKAKQRFFSCSHVLSGACAFLPAQSIDKLVLAIPYPVVIRILRDDGSTHHKFITQDKGYLVVVEEGVHFIRNGTFRRCRGLTSVILPSSLAGIGRHAFYGCTSLSSVTFPGMLSRIEYQAFAWCSGLTSVNFRLRPRWFPRRFTRVEVEAFMYCHNLTSVVFEERYTRFEKFSIEFDYGRGAFAGCRKLASVDLSDGNSRRVVMFEFYGYDPAAAGRSYSKNY